jgi:hypothetical protein
VDIQSASAFSFPSTINHKKETTIMATLDQADLDAITAIVKGPQGGFDPSDTPVQDPAEGGETDEVGTLTRTLQDGTVRVDHIIVPAEEE